jgi:hypothetical protein
VAVVFSFNLGQISINKGGKHNSGAQKRRILVVTCSFDRIALSYVIWWKAFPSLDPFRDPKYGSLLLTTADFRIVNCLGATRTTFSQ